MTLLYPELQVGYSVIRRPRAASVDLKQHVSGREIKINYWTYPLYEWDLTYEALRDFPRGSITSEIKRLQGFFLTMQGSLQGFYFEDPDDFQVIGQALGTTDGITTTFLIMRTYGDSDYGATVTEPIGGVNTITVYLNGIPQTLNTDYTLFGSPGFVSVQFTSAPASGQTVTADITYYFYVIFSQDNLDFEKTADNLWSVKKITLQSVRANATS